MVAALAMLLLVGAAPVGSPQTAAKPGWRVLPARTHKELAVFPVVLAAGTPIPDAKRYITLDEGFENGTVEVREVAPEPPRMIRSRPPSRGGPVQAQTVQQPQRTQALQAGGEVNRLHVLNRSGRTLILLAGELVIGGKQDRIVQKDTLVPPSPKPFDLPVFCVEQGRWRGDAAGFRPAANAGVAGGKGAVADPTVRRAAQAERSQSAVWDRVAEKNLISGAAPGAGTYQATVAHPKLQKDSRAYVDAIQFGFPKRGAVGAVIAVRGRIVWADVFASPEIFARYWPKLLHSYALDALTTSAPRGDGSIAIASVEEAREFLDDRSGKSIFEGIAGVCRLTRTEARDHLIFELADLAAKGEPLVHYNKMRKR